MIDSKKLYFLFLFFISILFARTTHALVVHDPMNYVVNFTKQVMDKAHHFIMESKTIMMAKTLYDTYMENKRYYDQIRKISEHQGGILGYAQDYAKEQTEIIKDQHLRMLNQIKNNDDRKFDQTLQGYKKEMKEKIDRYTRSCNEYKNDQEQMVKSSQKLNNDIINTIRQANTAMHSGKMQEVQTKLAVHQTQLLMDIASMHRAQQILETQKMQDDLQKNKAELVHAMEMMKSMNTQVSANTKNSHD
jgi:hypothetical protein